MSSITIEVSDDLLAELREKAAAEGKTVEELAGNALLKGLEDRKVAGPAGIRSGTRPGIGIHGRGCTPDRA